MSRKKNFQGSKIFHLHSADRLQPPTLYSQQRVFEFLICPIVDTASRYFLSHFLQKGLSSQPSLSFRGYLPGFTRGGAQGFALRVARDLARGQPGGVNLSCSMGGSQAVGLGWRDSLIGQPGGVALGQGTQKNKRWKIQGVPKRSTKKAKKIASNINQKPYPFQHPISTVTPPALME